MTTTHSTPITTSAPTRRRPASTLIAAILLGLIAAIGGYGSIYFTGLEGWTALGVCFVVAYEFLTLTGLIAVVALLRNHPLGRPGVMLYAAWMIYFTLFKLIAFHELQAIPFGVIAAVALVLVALRSAR
jgi:hypothetical protein